MNKNLTVGIVVTCSVATFWAIALVVNSARPPQSMLSATNVAVPHHGEGEAPRVTLTTEATAKLSAVWLANVHRADNGMAVAGCFEFGDKDYQHRETLEVPLFNERCKLPPDIYYVRVCWTPEQPNYTGLCARSRAFEVRASDAG